MPSMLWFIWPADRATNILSAKYRRPATFPKKFLETILLELKHAGMLGSKAGKGGGYYLRRKPGEINLAEVVRLFDGAIAAVPCATYKFYEPCKECEDETTCSIRHAFLQVRNATVEMLKRDTLEALVEKEQLLTRRKK